MPNRPPAEITLEMHRTEKRLFAITVVDRDGAAVDLSDMTDFRMVVHDENDPPSFIFESETVTVSGPAHNVATVTVTVANSANASSHWRWELWNVSTASAEAVLAHGPFRVLPAIKDG